jgi:hypothetical protein
VHENWQVVLRDALAQRDQLEKDAEAEQKQTGDDQAPKGHSTRSLRFMQRWLSDLQWQLIAT